MCPERSSTRASALTGFCLSNSAWRWLRRKRPASDVKVVFKLLNGLLDQIGDQRRCELGNDLGQVVVAGYGAAQAPGDANIARGDMLDGAPLQPFANGREAVSRLPGVTELVGEGSGLVRGQQSRSPTV